jgi:hypothetical protein
MMAVKDLYAELYCVDKAEDGGCMLPRNVVSTYKSTRRYNPDDQHRQHQLLPINYYLRKIKLSETQIDFNQQNLALRALAIFNRVLNPEDGFLWTSHSREAGP